MAAFFNLTLDTTAPSGGSISCVSTTGSKNITLTLAATGASQMKIWGGITAAATESAASWETYATSKAVVLTDGDGSKTINVKFRDDVGNETAAFSANTNLDTTAPTVTVTGPDKSTISKVNGYNEAAFTFSASEAFIAYTVRVVPASGSAYTAGAEIGTTNGSENMSGSGSFAANTAVSCVINGADLEVASSGDGAKIIKVFVKDAEGNWSV